MNPSVERAEQHLLELLNQFRPEVTPEMPQLAQWLSLADEAYLHDLFGSPLSAWEAGACPLGPARLLEMIGGDPGFLAERIAADIALAGQVYDEAGDVIRVDPFGLRSAGFPVVVEGVAIHCIWVRQYLTGAPLADGVERIAAAAGLDPAEAARLFDPVLNGIQEQSLLAQARRERDALQAAVEQHLQAGQLIQQLLQSERTRSLGTLSGGIAHRFNNLLSVILGYSSHLLNREALGEHAIDELHKISHAAQQGRRLTEEILSFAGSEVERETPCRVHTMLTSILSLLQAQASSRVTVETHLDASEDTVTAQPSAIHQLVFNLLTNAFDSIPGTGALTIRSANETVEDAGDGIDYLVLSVTDSGGESGPGDLPEEYAAAGRGIDLISQAFGIAGSLDGSATVRAEDGLATCVEVRLPITTTAASSADAVPGSRQVVPARIWIVDDDPIFRDMCKQVLGDEGHQTVLLESGPDLQALWSGDATGPDVLVLDFSMPEYNGRELTEWVRGQGSGVPIILVSGFSETQPDIHKALHIRHTHFLRKPFSFRELLDLVTVARGETLITEAGEPPR